MDDQELIEPSLGYYYYVERETSLVYAVQFIMDDVLVRPASPWFYSNIRKLTFNEFVEEFDELYGDPREVERYMQGFLNVTDEEE